MRKKLSVLLLILALIMNQAAPMGIKAADAADEVKVYVENGEGSLTEGDGTAQRPSQNIRPALKQIQTGRHLYLWVKSPTPNTRRAKMDLRNHYLLIKISRLLVQIRQQV